MTEFNTNLPSIRLLQKFVKDKQEVEIKLLTDDLIVGKVLWQDQNCFCILDHYEKQTLVWLQAIAFIKAKA